MRTTHFVKASVERTLPYDPDFHGLVEKKVDLGIMALKSQEANDARFRISFDVRFVIQETGQEMGRVSAEAESHIRSMEVPRSPDGGVDMTKASESFRKVVEGALGEDVLIPLSVIARSAHLPSLLPIPVVFPRHSEQTRKTYRTRSHKPTPKTNRQSGGSIVVSSPKLSQGGAPSKTSDS